MLVVQILKNQTFRGNELVSNTVKMALMNLHLHNIGDIYGTVPITLGDALLTDPGYRVDYGPDQSFLRAICCLKAARERPSAGSCWRRRTCIPSSACSQVFFTSRASRPMCFF